MTENEILMLICGLTIGAQTTAAWHMILDIRDARRNMARSRQVHRRATGDQFLSSFRLYRLKNRPTLPAPPQPHPAEVVQAAFRDFELKLYDGLDRIEDAARRDGLL